jgi:hypothetical protein
MKKVYDATFTLKSSLIFQKQYGDFQLPTAFSRSLIEPFNATSIYTIADIAQGRQT